MAFEVETVTEIEALLGTGDDDWDFEAIEMAARRMAMRVAARAVEQRLNDDTSDHAGPTLPSACGQSARYADRHGKNFESVLGSLRLERAYYYCELCEEGFCPRDRALGLEGGSLSPGVRRMVGLVGAMVSFEEGHELLHELAGVNVPTKHVERAAEALGREIAVDEKLVVEPPRANEPLAPTLYLGMDGTGVPVRKEELVDRPGKQPDGSAKTREVKLVTIWSAEGRDKKGTPVRDLGSISYSAAIESAAHKDTDLTPSEFAARVEREATRRGFDRAGAPGRARRWSQVDLEPTDPKGLSSRLGVRTNQRVDHVGDSRLFLLGHRSTVGVADRPGFDAAVQDLEPLDLPLRHLGQCVVGGEEIGEQGVAPLGRNLPGVEQGGRRSAS